MAVAPLAVATDAVSFVLSGIGGLFVTALLVAVLGVLFVFGDATVESHHLSGRTLRLSLLVSSLVLGVVFLAIVTVRSLVAI